jgi:ABC-type transport system involved in multi-copper enzyme maturation permease subunit
MTEGFKAAWMPDIIASLSASLAWTTACFVVAVLIFTRKDYKS